MLTKSELDKIALEYHSNDLLKDKFIEDECQFHTYNWVFDYIDDGCSILELGYGEGNFTEELVRRNFIPTVLDGSDVLLSIAKEKFGSNIKTIHALFEDFVTTEKFDIIIATHVLEHVDDPIALLRHLKTCLKEDGKIIIIVPNRNSLHRRLSVLMEIQPTLDTLSSRDILVGHQRVYDFDTLESHVKIADFDILGKAGFFLKVLPNSMMTEFSIELIRALNKISDKINPDLLGNIGLVVVNKTPNND